MYNDMMNFHQIPFTTPWNTLFLLILIDRWLSILIAAERKWFGHLITDQTIEAVTSQNQGLSVVWDVFQELILANQSGNNRKVPNTEQPV